MVYPLALCILYLIKPDLAKTILLNNLVLQTDFASVHILANKFCEINRILQNGGVEKRKHSAHEMAIKWKVPADDKGMEKEYTGIIAKWAKGRPLFREI